MMRRRDASRSTSGLAKRQVTSPRSPLGSAVADGAPLRAGGQDHRAAGRAGERAPPAVSEMALMWRGLQEGTDNESLVFGPFGENGEDKPLTRAHDSLRSSRRCGYGLLLF